MTLTHLDLDRIEGLAKAATPGPWQHGYWSGQCHKKHTHHGPSGPDPCVYDYTVSSGANGVASSTERVDVLGSDYDGMAAKEADLAYIAALDPTTVTAMITRIREVEGALTEIADWQNKPWIDIADPPEAQLTDAHHALTMACERARTALQRKTP